MVENYKFYQKYAFYKQLVDEIDSKKLPPDRYLLWIWKAGELYEEYQINLAKASGIYVADQIGIYIPGSNVSGKVDLRIINPESHKYSNIEVKSVYGYGGNEVLGTPGARKSGKLGTPRESNLMQIALYHWWTASEDESFEKSRLIYGARDTGRYAEYLISTEETNGITKVFYEGLAPYATSKVDSGITIESILEQYKYVQDSLDGGSIPARDYELKYSESKIDKLYSEGSLNKTDTERYEKRKKYLEGESTRPIKPVVKGDWQCDKCLLKNICYMSTDEENDSYGVPREL
jgi:hypothetical protein